MNEETTPAERHALDLLRQHDPASTVRPGAAARIEARLHRPAKKPRYAGAIVLTAIALSTASFAARALFWPAPIVGPVAQAAPIVSQPVAAVPAPRGSSLLEEARLLERVAQALKSGQLTEALAGVEAHEAKYPTGLLRLEALGFRVKAFEQLGAANVTSAMAEQWVAALSGLGRCSDAARLVKQPAQREAFARGLKGFCSP